MAGRTQVEVAEHVGVSQTAVSRWRRGQQGVDAGVAIRFARAVGDQPLAALIAAGFLTPSEAKQRPPASPDYSQLTNDELLRLVRGRMRDEGSGSSGTSIVEGPWGGPLSDPGSNVPGSKVAYGDPDLLPEREAQIEEP